MKPLIANYNSFMRMDVSSYSDEWIAIVNGELVAHSKSFKEVYKTAKKKFPDERPLVAKIPSGKVMIL